MLVSIGIHPAAGQDRSFREISAMAGSKKKPTPVKK